MAARSAGAAGEDGAGGTGSRAIVAWFGLILLAVCGAAVILYATPWGAGLGGDSYYYVAGARNLLAGLGFSRPAAGGGVRFITHYPPGYSSALAALTGLGLDTLVAARWLDAVLFGANILLVGLIVYRATRSAAPAFLAALVMLGSPALLIVHSWVLSEPLFLTLTLLAALALAGAVERGGGPMIAAAGLAAALSSLTRYAGLVLIPSGALAFLVLGEGALKRRLGRAVVFGAISASGLVVWAARGLAVGGSITNRALEVHPPAFDRLTEGLRTLSSWLLPGRIPFGIRAAATAVVAVVMIVAAIQLLHRGKRVARLRACSIQAGALLALSVLYPIALLASLTFVDASTPLDDRILSPLLVACIALGVLAGWAFLATANGGRVLRGLAVVVVAAFAAMTLVRGAETARRLRADGQGAAGRAWQESALVDWVRRLPEGVPIYSNELDILYLYTGRQAFQVPIRWDPVVEAPRDDYEAQLSAMRARLTEEGAVLALFDTISAQSTFLAPREELIEGLVEVFQSSDGAAYADSESGPWSGSVGMPGSPPVAWRMGRGRLE